MRSVAKTKASTKKEKKLPGRVPAQYRSLLIDRLERLFESGLISLTCGEYATLLLSLLPEDYAEPPLAEAATDTAPTSNDRIEIYSNRVAAGLQVFLENDADPDDEGHHKKGLTGRKDRNGGMVVDGWSQSS